ncbi:hypothetical protein BHE74_00045672 [Ensete ventricosum]|nr:hypothetical protein BHE74_00045672 [Ensete ventricosum]RZS19940.1 hypothetical protein BHM03_00052403 [Ensete ventricosum]
MPTSSLNQPRRFQVPAGQIDLFSRPVPSTSVSAQKPALSEQSRRSRKPSTMSRTPSDLSRCDSLSGGGENDRAYFGPSNIDFHITFQKPSRHIKLSSDQGLGKKHCPGAPLEELSHGRILYLRPLLPSYIPYVQYLVGHISTQTTTPGRIVPAADA